VEGSRLCKGVSSWKGECLSIDLTERWAVIVLVDPTICTCEDESNEKQDVWSKWPYSPYMVDDFRRMIGQTRVGKKACKGKNLRLEGWGWRRISHPNEDRPGGLEAPVIGAAKISHSPRPERGDLESVE
jgi:hypothetical protein